VPIGVVRSSLDRRTDAPRRPDDGPPAVLEIDERFAAALAGVEAGMDVFVITWLHEAVRDVLQVRRPPTGVFATRSPDRPNPIGIHRVTITAVDGTRVHVGALEAIDGTPVLDLKPCIGNA